MVIKEIVRDEDWVGFIVVDPGSCIRCGLGTDPDILKTGKLDGCSTADVNTRKAIINIKNGKVAGLLKHPTAEIPCGQAELLRRTILYNTT